VRACGTDVAQLALCGLLGGIDDDVARLILREGAALRALLDFDRMHARATPSARCSARWTARPRPTRPRAEVTRRLRDPAFERLGVPRRAQG